MLKMREAPTGFSLAESSNSFPISEPYEYFIASMPTKVLTLHLQSLWSNLHVAPKRAPFLFRRSLKSSRQPRVASHRLGRAKLMTYDFGFTYVSENKDFSI